ncbi:unnamed protein product [Adineta ricciae]|uniref:Lipocalin/cytosolic fatty-acid binding domain-containing protein n=1 Tax=Adineta ricciae TaxID=249248 RepID=A0A815HCV7_ADIRI|nr:unnamed protein product [Adineta ricciae]CAF1352265.1 unnamed protein product [Adineta ricciae]
MRVIYLVSLLLLEEVYMWPDAPCRTPPPAANYTLEQYTGRWFEIGKIQTTGGAFFEKDCVCTHIDVGQSRKDPSETIVSNICNKKTFDGKRIIANGTLTSNRQPSDGRYNETIFPAPLPVAYNIIVLQTNDFSVEYDCVVEFGIANYCVHILSRRPTLNETIVENLLKLAEQYDLNPKKLKFTRTNQTNCTYT